MAEIVSQIKALYEPTEKKEINGDFNIHVNADWMKYLQDN